METPGRRCAASPASHQANQELELSRAACAFVNRGILPPPVSSLVPTKGNIHDTPEDWADGDRAWCHDNHRHLHRRPLLSEGEPDDADGLATASAVVEEWLAAAPLRRRNADLATHSDSQKQDVGSRSISLMSYLLASMIPPFHISNMLLADTH